ncbi:MAG: OmpA family protein [Deltaproteobacteria bacterium]|nr:OmpA family protein [Deltaproteobacteria bacterium]
MEEKMKKIMLTLSLAALVLSTISLKAPVAQAVTVFDQIQNPTACDYVRRNREANCKRWYGAGEAPVARAPKVESKKIAIDQMVHFDFNKSTIKKDSYAILDDVASVLQKNPNIKKVRVEGHTDSIGSEGYNMKLSQKRADAVKQYLVSKGISATRLESAGYGKARPIAPNTTEEGRAKNRRTEFNVVEQ